MNYFIPKIFGNRISSNYLLNFLKLKFGVQFDCLLQNFKKIHFVYLFTLFATFSISGQTTSFPDAEGFGKYATGGRGGTVIKVTNLNDSGSGSLRAALEASGTRTVVFEVGGTITLTNPIYIYNGNLTIAGQTAPGDGILIKGRRLQFQASNIIVRYLRFRTANGTPLNEDCVRILAEGSGVVVENIIFDHCSMSWATDENFDLSGHDGAKIQNVTLQNSILAEATYGSLLSGDGSGLNAQNISIYRNLYAHNDQRNIRYGYPIDGTFGFEEVNNIIYGWGYSAVQISWGAKFSVVNNKFKSSGNTYGTNCVMWTAAGEGTQSETYAYIDGNDGGSLNVIESGFEPYLEATPHTSSGIVPLDASALETSLLSDVGCSFPTRDAVDTRIISEYYAGTGSITETGTYPTINGGTAPTDTDDDGMPDYWETENGLDINDASDRNIVQSDGYTNLEYYLNWMSLGTSSFSVNAGTNQTICENDEVTLTATGAQSYVWSSGETTVSITVSPTETTTYTVTGTDSEGNEDSDSVTVTVNPIPIANAGGDLDICEDNSVGLSASGGDSYQWSTGDTSQSISVSPQVTTTYTVTVTSNGCSSSDDVIVTVRPRPAVNAGNDVDIYISESTTLTAVGDGTFEWSTGETTESITVSPNVTTTYSVTAELNGCTNTDEVTVTVLEQDTVTADAGQDIAICLDESVTLTANGETNYTYLWNTGETTQSINVSPGVTTTYSVTVTNGAASDTDEVIVTVNPLPAVNAGNNVDIYISESTTLTAVGDGTFEWSTGETTESITVSPTVTTTYSVTASLNGCTNTDEVIVNVLEQDTVSANAGEDVAICIDESITLTANGGTNYSYLWNTGDITQSINVSPSVTTNYSVTVTNNAISDTDDVIVNVNPLPVANAGNDISIFHGEAITLAASGGTNYIWSTGETTQSISVNPTEDTTFTVEVIEEGCSAFDSVDVTVSVSANITEDVTMCQGDNTTLYASGGTNYLWSTGDTSQSINVSPSQTSNYTVIVSNGTSSDEAEVNVIVNLLPSANAGEDVTIEAGQSATLSASGGNSYLWNTGHELQNIAVSPTQTTTYLVEAIINGCSDIDEVTVTVVEPVNAYAGDDIEACIGEQISLIASGGIYYEWNTGETTPDISVLPDETTVYTVTVSNGISAESAEVIVSVDNCLDVDNEDELGQNEGFDYRVYPNPSNGEVNVRLSGLENISSIYITDVLGKTIKTETFEPNYGLTINKTYNLSQLNRGIYFITFIQSGEGAITKKLILQ